MDARDTLRRYLEQRREAGESELMLDSLSVDEALRLLGAHRGGAAASPPAAVGDAPTTDWRSALRAVDAAPRVDSPPKVISTPAPEPPTSRPEVGDRRLAFDVQGPAASGQVANDGVAEDFPSGIVVGSNSRELFGGPASPYATLDDIVCAVAACTACPLSRSAKNHVPGEGNPDADLVCVGEAPGATEDELGRPFVGQAGQLLTKILGAIQLAREDVYICNVLKHRPPGNRNPLPSEVEACSPFLVRQIELIRPKVIIAFGTFAAQTLLNTKDAIGKLRGKVHRYHGVPLVVTYHPAALLRNPAWKRPTWDDVQLARRLLDRHSSNE